jgi:YHS domain-containing protein
MAKCPVCGMMVDEDSAPTTVFRGKRYYFHKAQHKIMFKRDPEKFLSQTSSMSDH